MGIVHVQHVARAAAVAALVALPSRVLAQTSVALPNNSETTVLTASVAEQATVTVPAGATFNVTNINASTTTSDQAITISNIVLSSATKQLRISLQAAAASFTPPVAGATTWSAADVSWSTPNGGPKAWVNGTRANGTLSSTVFNPVATCNADAASCSTTGLTFTLAPKTTVQRSGNHTLVVTWKFESIGS